MKLRPYHNPENVDESAVPDGWRFRYQDEMNEPAYGPCRMRVKSVDVFTSLDCYAGVVSFITYIVPVNA